MKAAKPLDNVILLTLETRTLIFESSRTHKLVVRYKVIYWPYELPMGVQTCTQPRSDVATVSVGCEEVPEPVSGCRLSTSWAQHYR